MYACSNGVTFPSSVTAAVYYNSLDARLKTDVAIIENPFTIIEGLRGVTFAWKKDGTRSAGIIAQEVEKVMPSAVQTGADGLKAVDYDQLIAPMIEAIKAQQRDIKIDQQEIAALKQEIINLKIRPTH